MKIITVLPSAPRPFGTAAARWFYVMAKELLSRGHQISCFVVTEEEEPAVDEARKSLSACATPGQFSLRAFSPAPRCHPLVRKSRNLLKPFGETYFATGLREELDAEMARGYDVLHLEELWTGWLGMGLKRSLLNIHCFDIVDWENRRSMPWRDRKALLQMKWATRRILRGHKNISLLTSRLLEVSRGYNGNARYWVVPLAIDTSLYPLLPSIKDPVFGMIGSMHWFPSKSAAIRLLTVIWPLVKQQVPLAKLFIAGWNAKKHLGSFLPLVDVTVADGVGHPTDFFSKVSVMVYAPSRGSGMKIKVLESMAYGVPVVTTGEGVEGIDVENGKHCWVEEEDGAIAERVVSLLVDEGQREKMRNNARALLVERLTPGRVVDQVVGVYEKIVETDQRSRAVEFGGISQVR